MKKSLFKMPSLNLKARIKSWLNDDVAYYDGQTYVNSGNDQESWWKLLAATHTFGRKDLETLVEIGYTQNPAGFSIVNKILLAQRNIIFTPYWDGKPYKKHKLDLDINFGLQMLLLSGNCIVYEKEIVGFGYKLTVLDTLRIQEIFTGKGFVYRYYNNDGSYIVLDSAKMIFIKIFDPGRRNTQMGLPPLQAALMPIESLQQMYVADTSTLKNKGVDVLITNDSDTPLIGTEQSEMDKTLNERISGARRSGGVATSTAKLRGINLGRTTKELALWDGYKIKLRDICNVFQVDSGQFNDPDNKKFANVNESNKSLYNDCVIPFTRLITENKQLVAKLDYEIYLDTSNIDCLQVAQKDRAEKATITTAGIVGLNKDIQAKVITPEIAVKILVSEWGFDEAEAKSYIITPEETEPPAE